MATPGTPTHLLSQLLQLGVDLDTARAAVDSGAETLDDALDRVAAGVANASSASHDAPIPIDSSERSRSQNTLVLSSGRGMLESPFGTPGGLQSARRLSKEDVEAALREAEASIRSNDQAIALEASEKGKEKEKERERSPEGSKDKEPEKSPAQTKVASRYKESKEDHRMLADRKRAEEYAKFKKNEREAKQRILADIQSDRERNKLLHPTIPASNIRTIKQLASSDEYKPPAPIPIAGPSSATSVVVQVRIPDGSVFRRNFERSASIAVIWEFAGSFIQGKEWTLVETVPPRRRISRDPERTIADEGFGRDASLAVMRIDPAAEAKKEEQTARLAEPANEDVEMETESEPQPASAEPASPRTLNTAQQPRPQPRIRSLGGGQLHPFLGGTGGLPGPGTGMTIGGSPANRNSNARQTPGAVASRPTAFTHYPGFPTGGQIRTGFSHEHSGGSGFEGGGRTLAGGGGGPPDGDDGPADDQGGDEERRRREEDERRRRAAFLDSLARGGARAGSGATATSSLLKKDVSSLKDATLNRVAAMVIDPTLPAAALSELKHLSPQLSDALLSHLIATKKLDIHALKRIVARCPVTEVIMDSYRLATDSVLQILGTTTIRKLSLRGCGYLTDDGIRALAPLARHLTYLDLSNVKVTDKACPTIAGLKGLLHLDLSSTKVTISGLRGIARRLGEEPVLETLILNGCSGVTGPTIFEDLKPLKSLEQLSLASLPLTTPLTVPTGTQADVFPNLRILDVSRTKIADVDVQRIVCGFAKLTQLELKGCGGVTAKGLLEIARSLKNLSTLSFPSRELPFDTILPALASNRLPLISLDLEGAADLSDTGLAALPGFSSSLRSLSLAGLRTISLRALVTALSGLDLEKLDLDRVACLSSPFLNADTDEELDFARSIMRYSHLEEISLAQTGVSDRTLELWNGGPVVDTDEGGSGAGLPPPGSSAEKQAQFKRILRKLNLSKCGGITDRGVRCLGGFLNLSFVNLDHTGTTTACLDSLKDLSHLQKPRLLGIPPPGAQAQQPRADENPGADFRWAGPGVSLTGNRVAADPLEMPQGMQNQFAPLGAAFGWGQGGQDEEEEDEDEEMDE